MSGVDRGLTWGKQSCCPLGGHDLLEGGTPFPADSRLFQVDNDCRGLGAESAHQIWLKGTVRANGTHDTTPGDQKETLQQLCQRLSEVTSFSSCVSILIA